MLYFNNLVALHCAASRGHSSCIEILVKNNAEIDSLDRNGCTPLFYAITLGHDKCVSLLLKKGASASHQDKKGRT